MALFGGNPDYASGVDAEEENTTVRTLQHFFHDLHIELKISDLKNESDVEQKLIYPLLSGLPPEGMGYSPAAILTKSTLRIETIEKGGKRRSYVPDYILVVAGLPYAIVEAKTPAEDLTEAAREAHLYANEVNLRYPTSVNPCKFCIVSNGNLTQLRRSDSNDLLVEVPFDELVSCTENFVEFSDHIRFVQAQRIIKSDARAMEEFPKIRPLSRLGGTTSQGDSVPENSFGLIVSREFRNILNPADENDRANIIHNAYVESRRKQRHVEDIDRLIRAATPPDLRKINTIENTTQPTEVLSRFTELKRLSNQILLLIGNVGSGKSTFIDFLRLKALPNDVREKTLWLNIDLNDAPQSRDNIYRWCQDKLLDQFSIIPNNIDISTLEGLEKLFSNEVDKFKKGPGKLLESNLSVYNEKLYDVLQGCLSDKMKHISCLERYFCTNRGKLLVITLDNCDKRNRDLQLLMFEVARWLQSELRALIILPIRDTTYEIHKEEPPLDAALKDLIFKIEPPIFQHVLTKRIDLILKEIEQRSEDVQYVVNGKKVVFKRSDLAKYLKGMLSSLFENERFARRIITGLAGWDMRKAMEIFLDLCRSGFVDEGWILNHQVTGAPFRLSEDIVLKILMRTHNLFYNGDDSRIKNIYQIDRDSKRPCQFVRYWILLWFFQRADREGPSGIRGFHRCEDVVNDISNYGIDPIDVEREISYLCRANCLISESQNQNEEQINDQELIGLTPAGHVHINIAKLRSYLAGCAEDSYLLDSTLAEHVIDQMNRNRLYAKISWTSTNIIAQEFSRYLSLQEKRWIGEQICDHAPPNFGSPFEDISTSCSEEIERLNQRHHVVKSDLSQKTQPIRNVRDLRNKS